MKWLHTCAHSKKGVRKELGGWSVHVGPGRPWQNLDFSSKGNAELLVGFEQRDGTT